MEQEGLNLFKGVCLKAIEGKQHNKIAAELREDGLLCTSKK